jgi:hypothetical protein
VLLDCGAHIHYFNTYRPTQYYHTCRSNLHYCCPYLDDGQAVNCTHDRAHY